MRIEIVLDFGVAEKNLRKKPKKRPKDSPQPSPPTPEHVPSLVRALGILSPKESELFTFIGRGIGPRKVAAEMGIKRESVHCISTRVRKKLGLPPRAPLPPVYQAMMREAEKTR